MPTHYNGTEEEVLALDSYIKLTRAADSINNRLNNAPSMQELTTSQFGVLEALCHLGPLCQNVLGTKILKSNSNMTTVIDNLEKRGLVHRERSSEDRRMITVFLTQAGKDLIELVFPKHVEEIRNQFEVLTQEEQLALGALLRKLGKQEPAEDRW
jgi:MarR family 2-MHQ and catechol resistance regulon transcriptional repressor